MCGLAPSRVLASLNYSAGGWEAATVRVLPTAKVQVVTGATPHGQGHETCWSMIVADKLGVDPADVDVLHSDTAISPLGMDTYGSRSLAVGGVAIDMACDRVIDKARTIAAHQLEAAEEDLEFAGGAVHRSRLARQGHAARRRSRSRRSPPTTSPTGSSRTSRPTSPTTHPTSRGRSAPTCASSRSTRRPGSVEVVKYVAVDDCGNQINPLIVEGQVHGGIIQGLAQALFEGVVYDPDGNLITSTLADYMVPAASDVPAMVIDQTVTPSPTNPLGVKGIGEAGTIGSTPAVINAIVDALRPFGVTDVAMPASPMRVWEAIAAARAGGGVPSPTGTAEGPVEDPQGNTDTSESRGRCGVIPAAFDYVRAESADEALSLITQHGDEAKFLAGGHSLLPLMKLRLAQPSVLVDVGRLRDLAGISDGGDQVSIGALTRHHDVEHSDLLQAEVPILAHAAGQVGDPAVRHRGTIGGSLAHADPASDLPAVVLALGGTLVARSARGEREIAARDFFTGFLESALEPDELLTEIRVPKVPGAGWSFQKFNRRAQDWAIVGVAAVPEQRQLRRRPGEHGLHADPRHRRDRRARRRGQRVGRSRARGRRRRAAGRPQRQRGVPHPPGQGARAAGPRRGGRIAIRHDAGMIDGLPADVPALITALADAGVPGRRGPGHLAVPRAAPAAARCCSRARRAWARPRRRRRSAGSPAASSSASSATRASTSRRRSTSGTTPGSCSTSGRPRRAGQDMAEVEDGLYDERFLVRRPLLRAIGHTGDGAPPVLLIDEVDRADDEFEAFLLEILSDWAVTVPELGTVTATVPPVVVITSNRTRDVHDALKRRCLYHWVEHPTFEREVAIVELKVPDATGTLAAQVAAAVEGLRELRLYKPPGVAETIDWVRALATLGRSELDDASVEATLGSVVKYREDAERVRSFGVEHLVEAARARAG